MTLQSPASVKTTHLLAPTGGNAGLRLPFDCFALKSSFFSSSFQLLLPQQRPLAASQPKYTMRTASKEAYICRDCGYIYSDRKPFEKLPDNYFCPVCAAPKRRFRPYTPKVTKNANDMEVRKARKARKAQVQRDEAVGKTLPIAIAVGVVALAGLYFYLNSTF